MSDNKYTWTKLVSESSGENATDVYYIATDYGISPDSADNTAAMNTLMSTVNANGGGTIFIPVGIYNFAGSIQAKSHVSVIGENMEKTVLKETRKAAYPLFSYTGDADTPITGCTYSNFTVDEYETGDYNQVAGKCFFYRYVRNCVFRDLILQGSIATALGIDMLDNVHISNVNCIDCGRTYTGSEAGTSGIGIGTGGWEEENFTITDCVCVRCGQFGIFIENQRVVFGAASGNVQYSAGQVIANCIVRDGLNHGIGVRGGRNVTVTGCEVYGNAKSGIFVDSLCDNVKITNNNSRGNGDKGIYIKPTHEIDTIVVRDNVVTKNVGDGIYCGDGLKAISVMFAAQNLITENGGKGINLAKTVDNAVLMGNYTSDNAVGIYIGAHTFPDFVAKNNVLMDGVQSRGTFTGNTANNDYLSATSVAPESISVSDVAVETGATARVAYTVTPENADNSVAYEIANLDIATVDGNGVVTGVSNGETTITVRSAIDASIFGTATVAVADMQVTGITAADISVEVGKAKQIAHSVTPANAVDKSVSFTSTDPTIATVDDNGIVTGVSEGDTTVTIASIAVPNVSAVVGVQVVAAGEDAGDTHTFSNGDTLSVNGNHVKIVTQVEGVRTFNLSNVAENSNTAGDASNINNKPQKFTVSAGDTVVVTISNMTGFTHASLDYFKVGVRDTATANIVSTKQYSVANISESMTEELAITSDANAGCVYFYFNTPGVRTIEFDLAVTVNGISVFG